MCSLESRRFARYQLAMVVYARDRFFRSYRFEIKIESRSAKSNSPDFSKRQSASLDPLVRQCQYYLQVDERDGQRGCALVSNFAEISVGLTNKQCRM